MEVPTRGDPGQALPAGWGELRLDDNSNRDGSAAQEVNPMTIDHSEPFEPRCPSDAEDERTPATEAGLEEAAHGDCDPDGLRGTAPSDAGVARADDVVDDQHSEPAADEPHVDPAVARIIPEEYADFLDDRPLMWYDSEVAYDGLLGAVFAELEPKGIIECLLVKDFVDYVWELRGLKRLKTAAIHNQLPDIVEDVLTNPGRGLLEMLAHKQYHMDLARSSGNGNEYSKVALAKLARKQHLKPVDLHLPAYRASLPLLEAISRAVERLERRKDQILKQLYDRRATLAAMARSLLARDEAETIDVGVEGV
jgi:hypothetical protein